MHDTHKQAQKRQRGPILQEWQDVSTRLYPVVTIKLREELNRHFRRLGVVASPGSLSLCMLQAPRQGPWLRKSMLDFADVRPTIILMQT